MIKVNFENTTLGFVKGKQIETGRQALKKRDMVDVKQS